MVNGESPPGRIDPVEGERPASSFGRALVRGVFLPGRSFLPLVPAHPVRGPAAVCPTFQQRIASFWRCHSLSRSKFCREE